MKPALKNALSAKLIFLFLMILNIIPLSANEYYVGKGQEGKYFIMLEPVVKDDDVAEKAWLSSAVSAPLKTGLKLYTGMIPVSFENTDAIKEIQKKVESGAYDASAAVIEAGKLQDAHYGVFVNITKTGTTYQMAVSITNLTTAKEEATAVITNVKKATELQDETINALIIKLAPQLNVSLTALGLYTLTQNTDGSIDEQMLLAKQEAASYQLTIDNLARQLSGYSNAQSLLDQKAMNDKAALEAEMQLVEQRKLAAERKTQMLAEQKQKEELEAIARQSRSSEATEKLKVLSSQAEDLAAQLREKQMEDLTAEEQITIIEQKKAAYMEIHNRVQNEINQYRADAEAEYKKQYMDPDDPANYPAAFYKDGVFNKDYRNVLIAGNDDLMKSLDAEADRNIQNAISATRSTLSTLLKEINTDLKNLAKTSFTISSLEYKDLLKISDYDVNDYTWKADASVAFFNQLHSIGNVVLSYQSVTGNRFPTLKTIDDFNNYAATYDIFDAMIRMGTPFLILETDYTVTAVESSPSTYKVVVEEYRIKNTITGEIVARQKPSKSFTFSCTQKNAITQSEGEYDIPNSMTGAISKKIEEEQRQQEYARLLEEEAYRQRIEAEEYEKANEKIIGVMDSLITLQASLLYCSENCFGLNVNWSLDVPFGEDDEGVTMRVFCPYILTTSITVFSLSPLALYIEGAGADVMFKVSKVIASAGCGLGLLLSDNDSYLAVQGRAGVSIPLSITSTVDFQYSSTMLPDAMYFLDCFSAGISFHF